VTARILHDTIDDAGTSQEDIEGRLGAAVGGLVRAMTEDAGAGDLADPARRRLRAPGRGMPTRASSTFPNEGLRSVAGSRRPHRCPLDPGTAVRHLRRCAS
jgi:hypothetical protein